MRKIAVLALSVVLVTFAAVGVAIADQHTDGSTTVVETRGGTDFISNKIVFSTLAFHPGEIKVKQGDTVAFVFADEDVEPHTATVVNQEDIPDTVEEVFGCEPCNAVLEAHFSGTEPEEGAPQPPADHHSLQQLPDGIVKEVNQGEQGFDTAGDSLLFFPGETIETTISAPPGDTLYYVCAIHPWMQGSIEVTGEPAATPTAAPTQ
jgi:plastocyanin